MTTIAVIGAIPSPATNALHLGPLQLRAYGVAIALGALAAIWLARRRWSATGGDPDDITSIALWAIPAGLIGARIYHVVTDNELYRGRWLDVFKIWQGGLGIWGGVLAGVLTGMIVARRKGLDIPRLLDAVAPAIPLAQAIGRLGNWFNQELFGRPTSLPWGLQIDPANRPTGYAQYATFHPTFLYEALWNLCLVAVLIWVIPRIAPRLRTGHLFAIYVAGYTAGRLWVELLRIDAANQIGGARVNVWVSIVVFAAAVASLFVPFRSTPPESSSELDENHLETLED